MRIDRTPRFALLMIAVAAGFGANTAHADAARGGTLGRWTNAPGVTGECLGGAVCSMAGAVGTADCKEASGASCSGQLNSVEVVGPGGSCSGTGQTTFTYTSGTLMSTQSIPVTVTMASGAVAVDGSNGFLTVHATFDVFCIPEVQFATSFAVLWSGVVSFASAS